jgi:hypothetical protein
MRVIVRPDHRRDHPLSKIRPSIACRAAGGRGSPGGTRRSAARTQTHSCVVSSEDALRVAIRGQILWTSSVNAAAMRRAAWGVESEFVVASPKVMDECVSSDDRLRGAVGAQSPHRSEPVLELAVTRLGSGRQSRWKGAFQPASRSTFGLGASRSSLASEARIPRITRLGNAASRIPTPVTCRAAMASRSCATSPRRSPTNTRRRPARPLLPLPAQRP